MMKLTIRFLSWVLDEAFSLWTGPGVLGWDHPVGLRLGCLPVWEGHKNETKLTWKCLCKSYWNILINILTWVLIFWGILLGKEEDKRVFSCESVSKCNAFQMAQKWNVESPGLGHNSYRNDHTFQTMLHSGI